MGWWGYGIMDGDTPMDAEIAVVVALGFSIDDVYYSETNDNWVLVNAALRQPEAIAKIISERDSDIYMQVAALMLMRAGADISSIKPIVIQACAYNDAEDEDWKDGGDGRRAALAAFSAAVEAYDNKTPTDPIEQKGLFGTLMDAFAQGHCGDLINVDKPAIPRNKMHRIWWNMVSAGKKLPKAVRHHNAKARARW